MTSGGQPADHHKIRAYEGKKMGNIQQFAKKHTFIYCILAEIFVLGGMMLCSVAWQILFKNVPLGEYTILALQEACGALLAYVVLRQSGGGDVLLEKGIGFRKGLVVGGYFLVVGVISAASQLVSYEGERMLRPGYEIAVFAVCMFLVGMTEEFLCRGTIAQLLLERYGATKSGVWRAVIVSGILFGMAHLTNLVGADPVGVFVQCVVAGMMGMAFAAIYFRSGNIWVVVFLHGFIDLCGLITSGLYGTGGAAEVISGYQLVQLIGVIYYVILLAVLLRKKKMNEILMRINQDQ